MPNDDLGTFPTPPLVPSNPTPLVEPIAPDQSGPIVPEVPVTPIPIAPPVIPDSVFAPEPPAPPFEETPDIIPSVEVPATLPPKSGSSVAPIIITILLIVAGTGLAAAAFLSAQTNKLKGQLLEITQTLEKQQTTLTPTVSPTVFEIPTPTTASQSSHITPSITPIAQTLESLFPLKNASSALQIAINHSPNAQLILIKVDNATSAETAVTKYFFREDLSTKKYFYVAVTDNGSPEIIDKQIYVTPDDNIPSLNDSVLGNKLGLDLGEAIRLSYTQCTNQETCTTAPIKAQYIKTGSGIIWQLSLYTNGQTGTPLMIQINAETKAILYKSPEFGNK